MSGYALFRDRGQPGKVFRVYREEPWEYAGKVTLRCGSADHSAQWWAESRLHRQDYFKSRAKAAEALLSWPT